MTNLALAEQLRLKIQDDKTYHNAAHYGSNYDAGTGPEGTSHLSVLAPNGDAVSVTTTINFRYIIIREEREEVKQRIQPRLAICEIRQPS